MNNSMYKQSFKLLLYFLLLLLAARLTKGAAATVIALFGVAFAIRGRIAKALLIVVFLGISVVTNSMLLPKASIFYTIGVRVGPLLIMSIIAAKGLGKSSNDQLPMGVMLLFLVVAGISSAMGYAPMISYMKLINFTVFFLGVWLGSNQLRGDVAGLRLLRAGFFAMTVYIIMGSVFLIPFPGLSTMEGLRLARASADEAASAYMMQMREAFEQGGGAGLFCGIIYHSQALAGISGCVFGWLICDFLFIEGRFRWPHFIVALCAIPILYLTRSRVALLSFLVALFMVYFYLSKKVNIDRKTRRWLGSILFIGGVLLIAVATISEINDSRISKWIRKTNEVKHDNRSITEAFTSSRQGLIEMCLFDFKQNPLFGMGFQVAYYTPDIQAETKGFAFSSPIEKGVWPVMVLGETGIIGEAVFLLFLLRFWYLGECRRLFITVTLMTVFLATNLGEATFFSPGGAGGVEWLFSILGGYVLDIHCKMRMAALWMAFGGRQVMRDGL